MTGKDREQDNIDLESIAKAMAQSEVRRLERVRREHGEALWAECLGESIVTQMTLIGFRYKPGLEQLFLNGEATLKALEPQILELYQHPKFGGGMAEGIIKGLANRRYLTIDVEALCHPPYRPKRRSR